MFQDRKWCFCPLKTKNAYRSVNITESFCNYLKKVKAEQDLNRELYGNGYKRNFVTDRLIKNKETYMEITDFVNVKVNGEMLSTNSIKFMSRIIKNELKIAFKFHNLRHTYATILAESGISPRYVQEMLNSLSDFIFSAIKTIDFILLGFGVVQIGLSLKSHDASQRANGFLTFFGGVIIAFAKDILDMIM